MREFRQHILPARMGLKPTRVWSYGSVNHPGSFNYPALTIEAAYRRPARVKWINGLVGPSGDFRRHLLPVEPDAPLGEPARRRGGSRRTRQRPVPLRGARADRDSPARRPQHRGERRLPRGLVPARRAQHPRRVRQDRIALPPVPGQGRGGARPALDTGQRRLPVRQRSARSDDVVPRPHARHDARQRLRRTGRLLPASRRARRRRRRGSSRALRRRSAIRRGSTTSRSRSRSRTAPSPRTARCSTPTTAPSSRASTRPSCRCRSCPTGPVEARATSPRSGTRSSSATRWSSTAPPGPRSRCSSGATASASSTGATPASSSCGCPTGCRCGRSATREAFCPRRSSCPSCSWDRPSART